MRQAAVTKVWRMALLGLLSPMLAACGGWLGDPEAPPLPGERISVLALDQALLPDPRIADLEVRLPPPVANEAWPQAGGTASHAMYHLAHSGDFDVIWRTSIGSGGGGGERLLAPPVVAGGRVFTMDTEANVVAVSEADGERLWRVNVRPEAEDSIGLGGAVSFHQGRLFVTTGYGDVLALDPASGEELWRQRLGVPFRSPPTADSGRVFVVTIENQLYALDAEDGRQLWNHLGIPEDAGLIGGAAPAVAGDVVTAAYSSGELFALRVENGRVLWGDQVIRISAVTPLSGLTEIRGYPVLDQGQVVAISHSGRMAAYGAATGERHWDREIAGLETPWVAGDFLFLVTLDGELACVSRRDGRVRWVVQLPRFEDAEDREDPIQWSGPVLAGERLVVAGSHGEVLLVSPYGGEVQGRFDAGAGVSLLPAVANGTMYLLTDNGTLLALR